MNSMLEVVEFAGEVGRGGPGNRMEGIWKE